MSIVHSDLRRRDEARSRRRGLLVAAPVLRGVDWGHEVHLQNRIELSELSRLVDPIEVGGRSEDRVLYCRI